MSEWRDPFPQSLASTRQDRRMDWLERKLKDTNHDLLTTQSQLHDLRTNIKTYVWSLVVATVLLYLFR